MKRYIHYYICAAAMLFAACTEDVGIDGVRPEAEPINLSAGYETLTRVTEQGFDNGDQMGIYVVDYVDGAPASLTGEKLHADNVQYTYRLADNRWSGATTLYWNDKTTPVDIYGYYPFDNAMSQPTAYAFNVNTRQDAAPTPGHKGGYEASDLLWAKAGNVAPTSETIQLLYHHVMAGVTIRLEAGNGFDASEWAAAEKKAWIYNTVAASEVNLETGSVLPVGSDVVRITPLEHNGDFRAVVVPQAVDAGRALIGLTIDGQNYSLAKDAVFTYTGGKMHTFTIKVDKRHETGDYEFTALDETITAWLDDVEFHDGIVTEYVCVHVEQPGTLCETMNRMGLDMSRIECLKVTGTVDWNDFGYIRENQKILTKLNLYDVVIDDEDDEKDDVLGNLAGGDNDERTESLLRYVTFPKRLKKIADKAFYTCPLVGSFILPEGLEYIGKKALTARDTNGGCPDYPVGELYLPSTLKYIGNEAFHSCAFTGDIHLPDSLEYIGDNAFDHSYFSGTLTLPSSLKYFGGSAIRGNFSGDIIIPQGMKEISGFAFNACTFTGSAILPEGLEIIGGQSFGADLSFDYGGRYSSKIRGELVLPSTVKEIQYGAFGGCQFNKVVFPENLIAIGRYAFNGCNRITGTITIPKGVTVIEECAFVGCSMLTGIELHKDIVYLGTRSFAYCPYITSIVCHAEQPPLFEDNTFEGLQIANVTVEVPEKSVPLYQQDQRWSRFKRITAYKNFVCRPQKVCALNTSHEQQLVLNADGDWTVTHKPDWCRLSALSGSKKTQISLSIDEMARGAGNREDYIEFALAGSNYTTRCDMAQYDCEYGEDEVVTLQQHTRGNGIKIVMVGDGWNGEDIAGGSYLQQCNDNMEYFFGLPPYDRLREYFDVYSVVALSQERGVNTVNTVVNTRFNTIFSLGGCGTPSRLIPDEDLVFSYVKNETGLCTDEDLERGLVILMPNTTDYTGCTYYFDRKAMSLCPPSVNAYPNDSRGVVQHEACGHGFGKLGDEIITSNRYATSQAKDEVNNMHWWYGWYQNLSTTGKMNDVPWAHLIFNPQYSDYVDIFEGAYGYSRGIWRSEANSCMNYGIPYFNAISRQTITKRVKDAAGEWFDIEDFYNNDTRTWGSPQLTRTGNHDSYANSTARIANHRTPVLVKGNELRNLRKELKKKQQANNQR